MNDVVGFVGTGSMGTAIVQRLLATGHQLLVHNRTRANAAGAEGAGAGWASSLREVTERCDVVLSCLRDTAAVETIYLGTDGLIDGARSGQILIEHGTFAPELARRIAAVAAERGASFLAAPVSGGPDGARAGTLAVMVGGDPQALERARPALDDMAGRLAHVGGPSAGLELKLVNQLLTSAHMAVAGEAVALLQRLEIDLQVAGSLLGQGWAQSAMLTRTVALVCEDQTVATGATIQGMREVLELVSDLLAEKNVPATVFDAGQRTFVEAAARGLGGSDPAALHRVIQEAQ